MPDFSYESVMGGGDEKERPTTQPSQFSYESVMGGEQEEEPTPKKSYLEEGPKEGVGRFGFDEDPAMDRMKFMGYTKWAWMEWQRTMEERGVETAQQSPQNLAEAQVFWNTLAQSQKSDEELYKRVKTVGNAFYLVDRLSSAYYGAVDLLGGAARSVAGKDPLEPGQLRREVSGEEPWMRSAMERGAQESLPLRFAGGAAELAGSVPFMAPAVRGAGMVRGLAATGLATTQGGAEERLEAGAHNAVFAAYARALTPVARYAMGKDPGLLRTVAPEVGQMIVAGGATRATFGEKIADAEAVGFDAALGGVFGGARYKGMQKAKQAPLPGQLRPKDVAAKRYEAETSRLVEAQKARATEAARRFESGEPIESTKPTPELVGGLSVAPGTKAAARGLSNVANDIAKVTASHLGGVESYGTKTAKEVSRRARRAMEKSAEVEGRTSLERDAAFRETAKNTPETRELASIEAAPGKEYAESKVHEAVMSGKNPGPATKAIRALSEAWGRVFEELGVKQKKWGQERDFKVKGSVEEGIAIPRFLELETQNVLSKPYPKLKDGKIVGGDPRVRQLVEQTAQINFDKMGGSLRGWRRRAFEHWERVSKLIAEQGPDYDIGLMPAEIARELPHLPASVRIDVAPLGVKVPGAKMWMHVLTTHPHTIAQRLQRVNVGRSGFIQEFGQGDAIVNRLRERWVQEHGSAGVRRLNNLLYTLQGRSAKMQPGFIRDTMAYFQTPGGAAYALSRGTGSAARVMSSLLLSGKALKDPFEPSRGVSPAMGRALRSMIRNGTPTQKAAGMGYLRTLESRGLWDPVIRDWSWDPRRPAQSFSKIVSNTVSRVTGQQFFDNFSEKVFGQTSEIYVEMMKAGKHGPLLRSLLREMKFTRPVIEQMLAGKGTDAQYLRFQRQFVAKYVPSRAGMAERSIRETHPAARSLYKFSSYAESILRDVGGAYRQVGKSLETALENPSKTNVRDLFDDAARTLQATYGTAQAGALAMGLTTVVLGVTRDDPLEGAKRVANEVEKDAFGFLTKGLFDALTTGPFGSAPRVLSGEEGVTNIFVPVSMGKEAFQAATGTGEYYKYDFWERAEKFLGRAAPGFRTGVEVVGAIVSEKAADRRALLQSKREFYKFLTEETGRTSFKISKELQDFDREYLKAIRKMEIGLQRRDPEMIREALVGAYRSGAATPDSLASSILGKRILPSWMPGEDVGPKRRKWKWEVLKRVKAKMREEDWRRIVVHDKMLEEFAKHVRRFK